MSITPDQFEAYETMLLSQQIADVAVSALLDQNPEFKSWYRQRAEQRQTPRRVATPPNVQIARMRAYMTTAANALDVLAAPDTVDHRVGELLRKIARGLRDTAQ